MPSNEEPNGVPGCPDRDLLVAYSLGKLSADLLESVAAHVAQCQRCAATLDRLPAEADVLIRNLRRFASLNLSTQTTGQKPLSATVTEARPSCSLPARTLTLPCRLGPYELLEELGRGGMGVVYKARQLPLNRFVALKVAFGGRPTGVEELTRFRNESQLIAGLRHENIVHIYDYGETAGRTFFAMELLEGGSLDHKLASQPLPEREAALLVQTLARAVQYAHQHQVIHRDLKPANVLLGAAGEVKLSDFGLAKLLGGAEGQTHPNAILGTASYMAPEQARGENQRVGPPADIYGLGAILYQTLTGRPPFRGKTQSETREQVRTRPPLPPSRLRRGLSPDLEAICLKCLEKTPEERYPSAEALAEDLERWLRGVPIRRLRWDQRIRRLLRRHPVISSVTALLGTAALLLAGVTACSHPAFQLWKIERDLSQGKQVVLIGETGGPRWYRERVPRSLKESPLLSSDHFSVQSWELALVELVSDPQVEAYQFRAKIRHEESQGQGEVGLYVAYEQSENHHGNLHQFLAVQFNGARFIGPAPPNNQIPDPQRRNPVTLFPRALLLEPPNTIREEIGFLKRTVSLCVPSGYQWHNLIVNVTPKEVRAFWENEDALEPLSFEEIAISAEKELGDLRTKNPESPLGKHVHSHFNPRGGVGLYVFRSAASFQSVVLEPK
jgi:serine/threonine-protein kinase